MIEGTPGTYLGCPFCPSQSYPAAHKGDVERALGHPDEGIVLYRCPLNHVFFVKKEKKGHDQSLL